MRSPKLVEVVHLADHLARQQRIGYSGYNRVADVPRLAEHLGLNDQAVESIVTELGPQIEQNCRLVGLADLTTSKLYTQALADANEELGRLNAELTETNRRLETRSLCFDALRSFHASLSTDDHVPDVCRAAATCTRKALQLDEPAVCFAVNQAGTIYHVGTTLTDQQATAVVTPREPIECPPLANEPLVAVPAWAEPVRERFAAGLGDRPVWMLPIRHLDRLIGGVLMGLEPDRASRLATLGEELGALGGAFGLAIANASDRTRTENLIEELADANRRLHLTQEQLLRSKSVAMVAEMAAGAAHELNNPLAVIAGRAQMLAVDEKDESRRQSLSTISQQAQRASEIVSELIAFAKPGPPVPQSIKLGPWLARLVERWWTESSLKPDQLRVSLADPAVVVRADPEQTAAIFDALIANAIEATAPESARLVINSPSRASDDLIVIGVEDNGRGMSAKVLEHVLDPFFSHRPAGRGRGLGLSRAYSLAVANGGRLWLESTPDVGTTVFVELPAHKTS
jgi:signal transduction histidine kinase